MKTIDWGWGERSGLIYLVYKHEDLSSDTQHLDKAGHSWVQGTTGERDTLTGGVGELTG